MVNLKIQAVGINFNKMKKTKIHFTPIVGRIKSNKPPSKCPYPLKVEGHMWLARVFGPYKIPKCRDKAYAWMEKHSTTGHFSDMSYACAKLVIKMLKEMYAKNNK